jgi:hypothetical protein
LCIYTRRLYVLDKRIARFQRKTFKREAWISAWGQSWGTYFIAPIFLNFQEFGASLFGPKEIVKDNLKRNSGGARLSWKPAEPTQKEIAKETQSQIQIQQLSVIDNYKDLTTEPSPSALLTTKEWRKEKVKLEFALQQEQSKREELEAQLVTFKYDAANSTLPELFKMRANFRSQLDKIEAEIEKQISKQICISCRQQPSSVLLQPCRHLILCEKCAEKASSCPKCSSSIQERVKTQH